MKLWKIYRLVQWCVFGVAASSFVLAFVLHTVLAAANHRWGAAAAMALVTLFSVAVTRSAVEEMRRDEEQSKD